MDQISRELAELVTSIIDRLLPVIRTKVFAELRTQILNAFVSKHKAAQMLGLELDEFQEKRRSGDLSIESHFLAGRKMFLRSEIDRSIQER